MTILELATMQKEFDSHYAGKFDWDKGVSNNDISMLAFSALALSGEVGEAANLVKKIWRGDFSLDEKKSDLKEEMSDILSYLLKIAYLLNIDLEDAYLSKMKINKERFVGYEKK